MNRLEIPSDVVPSENHIGDRISAFKMLSGKDFVGLGFDRESVFAKREYGYNVSQIFWLK